MRSAWTVFVAALIFGIACVVANAATTTETPHCSCNDDVTCYWDVVVTGAGTDCINGTYTFAGLQQDGSPVFLSQDGACRIYCDAPHWYILSSEGFEYERLNYPEPTPPRVWMLSEIGQPPAPKLSGGEQCGNGDAEEVVDAALTDPAILVSSAADSGKGTLREALWIAEPGDTLTFETSTFPPEEPVSILLGSPLPEISCGDLVIDASDAGVILDGSQAVGESDCLLISSSGNTIRGLQIVDFPGCGILIVGEGEQNTIGGDRDVGNGPTGQGNRIASCRVAIWIRGSATSRNTILGNVIGTQTTGRGNVGNAIGIRMDNTSHNIIGPSNLLAYSEGGEIEIESGSTHNVIGPDNTFIHNLTAAIRIHGSDPLGNTITRNTFRTTLAPAELVECEIEGPRITAFSRADGTIAGTACPGCTVEILTGGLQIPYVLEGSAVADADGVFSFDKGESFAQTTVIVNATDVEGTTSAMRAPLCRAHEIPIPKGPGEIRVLSYNILGGAIGLAYDTDSELLSKLAAIIDRGEFWQDREVTMRLRNVLELMHYANADIIAFQELSGWWLHDEFIAKHVADELGMNYVLSGELGIFTRYEITQSTELPGRWDGPCPLVARLALPDGSELVVIDVHNGGIDSTDGIVLSSLLPTYINERAIVLGDFNLTIEASCLQIDPWVHISGDSTPDRSVSHISPDYIYVTPCLAPFASESLGLEYCAEQYVVPAHEEKLLSDHFPVMMVLVLPESE